jgi:hypothetical protein
MKRSKYSEEQIVCAIRRAEARTPFGDLFQQLEMSDAAKAPKFQHSVV